MVGRWCWYGALLAGGYLAGTSLGELRATLATWTPPPPPFTTTTLDAAAYTTAPVVDQVAGG